MIHRARWILFLFPPLYADRERSSRKCYRSGIVMLAQRHVVVPWVLVDGWTCQLYYRCTRFDPTHGGTLTNLTWYCRVEAFGPRKRKATLAGGASLTSEWSYQSPASIIMLSGGVNITDLSERPSWPGGSSPISGWSYPPPRTITMMSCGVHKTDPRGHEDIMGHTRWATFHTNRL